MISRWANVSTSDDTNPPTDPDEGLYADLTADNRKDFNDVVLMGVNELMSVFDFNGNRRMDFKDIVVLFGEI